MPTTFVKGDFLEETPVTDGTRVFAFGADVSGSMDAGIAVAMKRRWPGLETWWAERCANGRTHPGDIHVWKEGSDVVYALAVQRGGTRAKVAWLERAARALAAHATKENVKRVSVPRLWGGTTGLPGDRAKRVLGEIGERSPVSLVVFEQFIRAKEGGDATAAGASDDATPSEKPARAAKAKGATKSTKAKPAAKTRKPAAKPAKTESRPAAKKASKADSEPAPRKAAKAESRPAPKKAAKPAPKSASKDKARSKSAAPPRSAGKAKPATKTTPSKKKTSKAK